LGEYSSPSKEMNVDSKSNSRTDISEYQHALFPDEKSMPLDHAGDGELQERLDYLVNQMDAAGDSSVPPHLLGKQASILMLMLKVVVGFVCGAGLALWMIWPADKTLEARLPVVVDGVMQHGALPSAPQTVPQAASSAVENQPARASLQAEDQAANARVVASSEPLAKTAKVHAIVQPQKSVARPPAHKQVTAVKRLVVGVRVGNVRTMPDTSARVLYRLKKGAVVTRLDSKGEWLKVRLRNGVTAWAHQSIF